MSCKYNNCKHCGYKSECEIFKENAELKEKLNFSTQYYQGEKAKEQLIIAKCILRMIVYWKSDKRELLQFINKAEQFIKDSEVEK